MVFVDFKVGSQSVIRGQWGSKPSALGVESGKMHPRFGRSGRPIGDREASPVKVYRNHPERHSYQ